MTIKPGLNELITQGEFYLQQIDHEFLKFVAMTEKNFLDSPFLDHRLAVPEDAPRYQLAIGPALSIKLPNQSAPSRYLLHVSHVGSTLVSRALGCASDCHALREPLPLRYLAKYREALEEGRQDSDTWLSPKDYRRLMRLTLTCLNKPLNARKHVTIKCTSWCNGIADELLAASATPARVVGISTSLETFTANILKSPGARKDLSQGAPERVRRLQRMLPGLPASLAKADSGTLAAMAWLVEMMSIQSAATRTGADLLWLDFDQFLLAPEASCETLAGHLALTWDDTARATLHDSGLLTRYAKHNGDKPYSAADRSDIISGFAAENPAIINVSRRWLDTVAQEYPVAARALAGWNALGAGS